MNGLVLVLPPIIKEIYFISGVLYNRAHLLLEFHGVLVATSLAVVIKEKREEVAFMHIGISVSFINQFLSLHLLLQ